MTSVRCRAFPIQRLLSASRELRYMYSVLTSTAYSAQSLTVMLQNCPSWTPFQNLQQSSGVTNYHKENLAARGKIKLRNEYTSHSNPLRR